MFPGLASYINFDLEGPAAGGTQITSGALLLPPFFLLDKGFTSIDIFAVSPHTPVVDLGNPTLKTTESKTLVFVHISLSLSYCESWPPPTCVSRIGTQGVPSGTLRPLCIPCLFSKSFDRISVSFFLFFNRGLFSHYKSISYSQGEKSKSLSFPLPTPLPLGLAVPFRMLAGHLLHVVGGGAWGARRNKA